MYRCDVLSMYCVSQKTRTTRNSGSTKECWAYKGIVKKTWNYWKVTCIVSGSPACPASYLQVGVFRLKQYLPGCFNRLSRLTNYAIPPARAIDLKQISFQIMQIMTKRFYLTVKIYIWKSRWKKRKKMMREKLSKVSQIVSKSRVKGQQWKTGHLALANEDTLLRIHCCGYIVAHDVSWARKRAGHKMNVVFPCCANWETFVAGSKCFWTKSETFFVSRTQNLCPQQMLRARAKGKHLCPQQSVLVCQGLLVHVAGVICIHITWFEWMMDDFNVSFLQNIFTTCAKMLTDWKIIYNTEQRLFNRAIK